MLSKLIKNERIITKNTGIFFAKKPQYCIINNLSNYLIILVKNSFYNDEFPFIA